MQGTSPGPGAGKTEWRAWLRGVLATVAEPERQSGRIRLQLIELLKSQPAARVAIFSPLPGEPCLLELLESLPGQRWVLPRVEDDWLVFHPVEHPGQLQPGAFGIAEPPAGLERVPPDEIDIFLCPGLGFDRIGTRLGRGKGFYDRVLANADPSARILGVAFREQIVDRLPGDPHDIQMHRVVSGSGPS